MADHISKNKTNSLKDLISLASRLDSAGLTDEADRLDEIILKAAASAPSISRFKTLLTDVLKGSGYTVSTKPNEADIHIDPANPRWTSNLSYAWTRFAENVLKINEVATNWAEKSRTIGTGYSPNLGGMIDLLSDFMQGGRAQAGGNLGTLGEGGLAEQTSELSDSIEGQRNMNSALQRLTVLDENSDSRLNRSRQFSEKNDRLLQEQRDRAPAQDEASNTPEAEPMANLGPNPSEQVFSWGEWEQKRDSNGKVTGYRRSGDADWMSSSMFETKNIDGTMKTQPVSSDQRSFSLGLGGSVGERPVANIGKRPLARNRGSWTSSK